MDIKDINLNLLKTFYNVVVHGGINVCAEKTFVAQSAISRSIKQLENVIGVTLFYRNVKGVSLTQQGKLLFNYVNKMFENLDEFSNKIKEKEALVNGLLTIGVPSQIASIYLFDAIARFHKDFPLINITIISKTTSQLIELIKNKKIDFIIDSAPIEIDDMYSVKNIGEYQNVFFTNDSYLDGDYVKCLKDLENKPLVLPILNTENRRALDVILTKKKIKLENIINIHTSEMIINAVKRNAGIGYTLKELIEYDVKVGNLKILDIEEELPTTKICLVYDEKDLSLQSNYFLNKYLNLKL